jgi:hypothetical protein
LPDRNLFIDFDPLIHAVAEFARVPAPLPHACPVRAASMPYEFKIDRTVSSFTPTWPALC